MHENDKKIQINFKKLLTLSRQPDNDLHRPLQNCMLQSYLIVIYFSTNNNNKLIITYIYTLNKYIHTTMYITDLLKFIRT